MFGTGLALASAIFAEMLDRRVRVESDVEDFLDLPVLAFIRRVKLPRRSRLKPPRLPGSMFNTGARLP